MGIRDAKNAVLSRLREDPILATATYEGVVTDRPDRYVAVFTNSGMRSADRLTGPHSVTTMTVIVHSVGTTPDQCSLVAERVFAQLVDFTPTIDGVRCRRISPEASQPMQRDDDISPPLYYSVDEFDLVYETL
jgi:hypothetical protein